MPTKESNSYSILIRSSTIPGGGLGAFWNDRRPCLPGYIIGWYSGKRVSKETVNKDPLYNRDYLIEISSTEYVDAQKEESSSWPRFINHKPKQNANCEYELIGSEVAIVSTCKISYKNELFCDYGSSYWN